MLKYRCPDCRSVHTLRPHSFYRRFRTPWQAIVESLLSRFSCGRWLKAFNHQSQQYWWRGFKIQSTRFGNAGDLSRCLDLSRGSVSPRLIVSTHSLDYFEISPLSEGLHLSFAVTPASGYG